MTRDSAIGAALLALVLLLVFGFIALYLAPLALATVAPVALSAIGTTIGVGVGVVAIIAVAIVGLSGAFRVGAFVFEPVASKVTKTAKKYEYEAVAAVLTAASTSGTIFAAMAAGVVSPTLEFLFAMTAFVVLPAGWVMQSGGMRNIVLGIAIYAILPLVLAGTVVFSKPPDETIASLQSLPQGALIGLGILLIVFIALIITAVVKDRARGQTKSAEGGLQA